MKPRAIARHWLLLVLILVAAQKGFVVPQPSFAQSPQTALDSLIPMPMSVVPASGEFVVSAETRVVLDQLDLQPTGRLLADWLAPAFGTRLDISAPPPPDLGGLIVLSLVSSAELGDEGYTITITPQRILLEAHAPAGMFYAAQTLRQLLPPVLDETTGETWSIPAATITDKPRYAYRGAMLDVARHFHDVDDVKRVIDLLSTYKMNHLHLHLSDDQGWRIEIQSWPDLTAIGSQTAVDGAEGGFYTQAQYSEIVAYAAERFITIVPEIDMPGHTNAALASYAELNCDGVARQPYTGIEVGFSTLCIEKDITYQFVDDVVRELAAITPGPYIHIGGDESKSTAPDDYVMFVERVQEIVLSHGKTSIGWEEIAQATLAPGTIVQHWFSTHAQQAVEQGAKVLISPASKIYLDMKYDDSTALGLNWAGNSSIYDSYNWDPDKLIPGVSGSDIIGVESPLWSETLETIDDIEYMLFPRLLGVAEIAWSPAEGRGWREYRVRLATHGPRLDALGVNFYRDDNIKWGEQP